jgi:hypothetical protein
VNFESARSMGDAVMYEGYILYPYRASSQKNQSRWQFGVVMSPGYAAVDPSERAFTQTECVLEHNGQPDLEIVIRFLQVQRRTTGHAETSWDEAVEREVTVTVDSTEMLRGGCTRDFVIPDGEESEASADGRIVRQRKELTGIVSVLAIPQPGPWRATRLQVRVDNRTSTDPVPHNRDAALPSALVAAHMIIGVHGGVFISMTDPPEWAKEEVEGCQNIGCWPVLAGADGGRDVMLSTPIILYDHPELAPESPGELYDGTEIDEILSLRTLALSDDEKRQARATDPRAAALIDRVEALSAADYDLMHGTLRSAHPAADNPAANNPAARKLPAYGEISHGDPDPAAPWWDPAADASVSPDTDAVTVAGQRIARGSLVTLRPGIRRTDAQDMFLAGRPARVEAVLHDVEDALYLAVSLADDPDEDLRISHGRFLYFAPDEVEPCEPQP